MLRQAIFHNDTAVSEVHQEAFVVTTNNYVTPIATVLEQLPAGAALQILFAIAERATTRWDARKSGFRGQDHASQEWI
ncbi:MAG: hypothetical protein KDB27_15770 [Planctomycetales bacterium]|nr:hypothetical protein [Planctomycetales bacterium]